MRHVDGLPHQNGPPVPGGHGGGPHPQVQQGVLDPVPGHVPGPQHVRGQHQVEPLPPGRLRHLLGRLDRQNMGQQLRVGVVLKHFVQTP